MKEVRKSHMATRNTDRNRQDRVAPMQAATEIERPALRNRPANENDAGTAAMLAKLPTRKGADRNRLTALPEPFLFSSQTRVRSLAGGRERIPASR